MPAVMPGPVDTDPRAPAGRARRSGRRAAPYVPDLVQEQLAAAGGLGPSIVPVEGTLVMADVTGFTTLGEQWAEEGPEGPERLTEIVNGILSATLRVAHAFGGEAVKFAGDSVLLLFRGSHHGARAVAAAVQLEAGLRPDVLLPGRPRARARLHVGVHSGSWYSAIAGVPHRGLQHFLLGAAVHELAEIVTAAAAGEVLVSAETLAAAPGLECEPAGAWFRVRAVPDLGAARAHVPSRRAGGSAAPAHVAGALPSGIAAATGAFQGGEHRRAFVSFVRLYGLEERLAAAGPGAALDALQHYMVTISGTVRRLGGFLAGADFDRSGARLLVLFGVPATREQVAFDAARFAGAMYGWRGDLPHAVALHYGPVFAANVGVSHRREFTVIGDAVNVAGRLLEHARAGHVVVSETAALDPLAGVRLGRARSLTVRGREGAVRIRPVRSAVLGPPADIDRSLAPFVDRHEELRQLTRLADAAERGERFALEVTGDPGAGKTRLIAQWSADLRERGWRTVRAVAARPDVAVPLGPWRDLVLGILERPPTEPITAGAAAARRIAATRPDLAAALPLLDSLLGAASAKAIHQLSDEQATEALAQIVAGLVAAVSEEHPVLLVLDDAHYADPPTRALTALVMRALPAVRMVLAICGRPSAHRWSLESLRGATARLQLDDLPPADAEALAADVLGREALPAELAAELLARCGGNPLYLEETALHLRDQPYAPGAIRRVGVPDRLHAMVTARIDAATPAEREFLRLAAVTGTVFDASVVAKLTAAPADAGRIVASLHDARFIVYEGSQGFERIFPTYRFRHELIRDVAYEGLSFAARRRLHRRVAEALESTSPVDTPSEVLADHFERAGDRQRARIYRIEAGDRARARHASDAALEHYRRALAALRSARGSSATERAELYERIGDCLDTTGRYREAADAYRAAWRNSRAALRRSPRRARAAAPLEATLAHRVAIALEHASDYAASVRWLDRAQAALPPRQPRLRARLHITRSAAMFRQGRYAEAVALGGAGLRLARRAGDVDDVARAHDVLATSLEELGAIEESIGHRRQAVDLHRQTVNLVGNMRAENNLASGLQLLGALDEAVEHYEAARRVAELIGNAPAAAIVHGNLGEVRLIQGRPSESLAHLSHTLTTFEETGEPLAAAGLALVNMSRVRQRLGLHDQAAADLRRGGAILRRVGARGLLLEALLQRGELALARGRPGAALATARAALHESAALGMRLVEARAERLAARALLERGNVLAAEQSLRRAVAGAAGTGARYERALSLLELAHIRRAQGVTSPPELTEAVALLREIGAAADLARAEQIALSR